MDGIHVFVFLVRCTTDLLFCQTIPTDHLRFDVMEECRSVAAQYVSSMQTPSSASVVMGKCRYQLAMPGKRSWGKAAQRIRRVQAHTSGRAQ